MNRRKPKSMVQALIILVLWTMALATPVVAGEVRVAAASSFSTAMARLMPLFEQKTGHRVRASYASTGKLFAQIKQGAPFDVFLAADDQRPRRLVEEGLAPANSLVIYALGRLVLWSTQPGLVDDQGEVLRQATQVRLAVANYRTAPYGVAALQVLHGLRVYPRWQDKLVQGENVGQALQFVHSGAVPLGFVAYAQILALPATERGSFWLVPPALHEPIAQAAVLLSRRDLPQDRAPESVANPAPRAFLEFLRSPEALTELKALGYGTAVPMTDGP